MATTTKKPAAKKATTTKKTTTAKPAAKKTAAAKPAAKKTTTAKPVAKKTTATVKTTEISVTGNKKVGTLRKEFNKKFPYLNLYVCYSYGRDMVRRVRHYLLASQMIKLLHLYVVQIRVEISLSRATRRLSRWRRSLILYLDSIARFAIQIAKAAATTHREVQTKRLLLHSMPSVRRMVARRVFGSKYHL